MSTPRERIAALFENAALGIEADSLNRAAEVRSLGKVAAAAAAERILSELQPTAPEVEYLLGGTRFKLGQGPHGRAAEIRCLPAELIGRWVALVDATDNAHMGKRQRLYWPTDPSYPCPTCGHVAAAAPQGDALAVLRALEQGIGMVRLPDGRYVAFPTHSDEIITDSDSPNDFLRAAAFWAAAWAFYIGDTPEQAASFVPAHQRARALTEAPREVARVAGMEIRANPSVQPDEVRVVAPDGTVMGVMKVASPPAPAESVREPEMREIDGAYLRWEETRRGLRSNRGDAFEAGYRAALRSHPETGAQTEKEGA